jgi:hypothetical protein
MVEDRPGFFSGFVGKVDRTKFGIRGKSFNFSKTKFTGEEKFVIAA